MKKNILLCLLLFALAFASCKKETSPFVAQSSTTVQAKKVNTLPGGGSYVYQDASGNFYTSYGYGFGYGSFFPYPTTVTSSNNGLPWSPGANGSVDYMGTNLYEYHDFGGYFTVSYLQQTNYAPSATAMSAYYQAFDDYISGKIKNDGSGQFVQPYLPNVATYTSSSYIVVFTGHYVIDSNSPTHVNILPITSSPGQPPVD